jgi:hypothetical protein
LRPPSCPEEAPARTRPANSKALRSPKSGARGQNLPSGLPSSALSCSGRCQDMGESLTAPAGPNRHGFPPSTRSIAGELQPPCRPPENPLQAPGIHQKSRAAASDLVASKASLVFRPLNPPFRQANRGQKVRCRFLTTRPVNVKNRFALGALACVVEMTIPFPQVHCFQRVATFCSLPGTLVISTA